VELEGDISQMDISYTPASDVESDMEDTTPLAKQEPVPKETIEENTVQVPQETAPVAAPAAPVEQSAPNTSTAAPAVAPPNKYQDSPSRSSSLPPGSTPVEGFQLVQATGLTDTSTPAPKGSDIPSFATATPIPEIPLPSKVPVQPPTLPPMPAAPAPPANTYNPLSDESKSKQFTARTDYMIAEFFASIFQQRFKESLGSQWAHITSQPEVEEAIKKVQDMYDYFESLEKIVTRQKKAIEKTNEAESELSLWYRKEGVSEPAGSIRDNMLYLSQSYSEVCRERALLIAAYEQYAEFLTTFKVKAIGDALTTMKKQHQSRLELDAYGSKLGQLEEKKLKTFARSPSPSESASLEKDLTATRSKFQDAKSKYQNLSTSLIDKAGLLDMKKGVDFAAHIQRIREVHDSFNRGRVGTIDPIPDEEDVVDEYMLAHGVPRPQSAANE